MNKKRKILIIYFNPDSIKDTRATILHHLRALEYNEFNDDIVYYNIKDTYLSFMLNKEKSSIQQPDISKNWDAIILHYSFLGIRTIGWRFRELKKHFFWIRYLNGVKIAIPQDEGDYAGLLDDWLYELDTDVIFSVHFSENRPLYPIMRYKAAIYPCLPGYIDEKSVKKYEKLIKPLADRKLDIVYRARQLPFWFGSAGRVKYRIAEVIKDKAIEKKYNVDISTKQEKSISGTLWFDFIASGKTVLGAPGGYSTIDWRGEIKAQAKQVIENQPNISFQQFSKAMPLGWDDNFLLTITPRHFEAVMLNTCQILIQDEYKGILIPDIHYIPVERDWSNIEEILEKINDVKEIQKIANQAREDLLLSGKYSYRVFASKLDRAINDHHYSNNKVVGDVKMKNNYNKFSSLERNLINYRNEVFILEQNLKQTIEKELNNEVMILEQHLKEMIENEVNNAFLKSFNNIFRHYLSALLKWTLFIFGSIIVLIIIFLSIYIL